MITTGGCNVLDMALECVPRRMRARGLRAGRGLHLGVVPQSPQARAPPSPLPRAPCLTPLLRRGAKKVVAADLNPRQNACVRLRACAAVTSDHSWRCCARCICAPLSLLAARATSPARLLPPCARRPRRLLELKIVAAQTLTHAQFFALFGSCDASVFADVYATQLRPKLGAFAQTFWDESGAAFFKAGMYAGSSGFAAWLLLKLGRLLGLGGLLDGACSARARALRLSPLRWPRAPRAPSNRGPRARRPAPLRAQRRRRARTLSRSGWCTPSTRRALRRLRRRSTTRGGCGAR
jgi:hypothetical protein